MLLRRICWLLALSTCHGSHMGQGDKNAIADASDTSDHLEPITGTPNFRLIKPDKSAQWFPEREKNLDSCVRRAKCEVLKRNSTCLGANLPYDHTSVHLTFFDKQEQIDNQLELYRELVNVPKCWAVIQPLLCATFKPKCERILGEDYVYLPSYEMCKITLEPCAILYNTSFFPSFLKCNETLFPTKCDNAALSRDMKFNTTGTCLPPLIQTEKAAHFYEGETKMHTIDPSRLW